METQLIYVMMVVSLVLTMVMVPVLIPIMKRLKYGQTVREEGPQHHRKKGGTPTMGGVVFVLATLLSLGVYYFFYDKGIIPYSSEKYLLLLFPFVGFSLIGLLDDYLIVVKKNNQGLRAKVKILMEIVIAGSFFYFYIQSGFDTSIKIFQFTIQLRAFYGVLIFFMLVGSANAVNLTDGLDGLAGGLSGIAVATMTYIAYTQNQMEVMIIGGAVLGSILGFLIFNLYPAKIFMGDTGSLALGAILASMAIILKIEWLLIVIGGVFVIETLSVIIQVAYFKKTKGKRIFKMTPLHHHFELSGLNETKVVLLFYVFGLLFSAIAVLLTIY